MPAPPIIGELVRRFADHQDNYASPDYKEARLRNEFLDAFFSALGWDVGNTKNYAESFKEVVVEDALKVEGAARAPDYAFRIGGQTQFYAEAKKPSINLKADPEPAFQLRRYAWTKKLPVSVLTDFQELAVYDTRVRPKPGDQARTARLSYFTFEEFEARWDEIASLLSKDAIQRGALERFAIGRGVRKGYAEVDDAFLEDIESWRALLAKDLHKENPALALRDLNFAVQRTIDRIVFLRICEDRGIEPFGRLLEAARKAPVYEAMKGLFQDADNKYNSGIFYFRKEKERKEPPDDLTLGLSIGDKCLREIVGGLYPPQSPYAFSVLPADILGQVYERFLGNTIAFKGRGVVVEPKPEVRKAGGVYYTPTYVVDYLVRQAVGPHFTGRTTKQVQGVRVLDPACGSGSFLIQAYQFILDWYLEQYSRTPDLASKGKNPVIRQTPGRGWRLTTTERKRILLKHLFGVDLDSQAVEVTKLSLLLKVLEGESEESLSAPLKLLHERALPDLGSNIKCGNSLIGQDLLKAVMFDVLPEDEQLHLSPFDWPSEFADAAKADGFDAIIGNPPYIPIESLSEQEKAYFADHFPQLDRKYDTSVVFLLAMLQHLGPNGLLGFISSQTWQTGENYGKLRGEIVAHYGLREVLNLPFDVFKGAYVDTGLLLIGRERTKSYRVHSFPKHTRQPDLKAAPWSEVGIGELVPPDFKLILDPVTNAILKRTTANGDFTPLGELTVSTQGLAGNRFRVRGSRKKGDLPFLVQGQAYRYRLEVGEVGYTSLEDFPSLKPFYGADEKLLIRRVISRADRLLVAHTNEELVFKKDINPFVLKDGRSDALFLLGILNSALISFLYVNSSTIALKDDFRQTTLAELRRLPVPIYNAKDEAHKGVRRLAEQLVRLFEKHSKASEREAHAIERQLMALDREVDDLVARVYRLTDAEKGVIRSAYPG